LYEPKAGQATAGKRERTGERRREPGRDSSLVLALVLPLELALRIVVGIEIDDPRIGDPSPEVSVSV
jgi:hypothetical protein